MTHADTRNANKEMSLIVASLGRFQRPRAWAYILSRSLSRLFHIKVYIQLYYTHFNVLTKNCYPNSLAVSSRTDRPQFRSIADFTHTDTRAWSGALLSSLTLALSLDGRQKLRFLSTLLECPCCKNWFDLMIACSLIIKYPSATPPT